ncbi:hypothetical protein DH2020_008887 [Rehmannia glutinosa]|uniref:F-box protein n=1 Tax=Rehmannia glutinosa TaxID=99300 RepID=A0ABR0X813_REHGL
MATLKASSLLLNSSISSSNSRQRGIIRATINIPKRVISSISLPTKVLTVDEKFSPKNVNTITKINENSSGPDPLVMAKLYAILEAVADRVEMHRNIGDQRTNWNTLLLTSINAITLAAATMAGIASISGVGAPADAMKVSSTAMYVAATGMLSIVNKIQPSQLAEEQRNAVRLFKQLQNQIQIILSIGNPTAVDVKEMMEKVLALDRAYPLPLLGAMLEKFPADVEPAVGPVLTGLAAVGSAFVGSPSHGDWAVVLGVAGGALASVVNALEHGGQVGMVFEMYRCNAGFFNLMEESIESNLREEELERRENGEVFEMKVGLQLGRSLSQLRDLAEASSFEGEDIEEFASKLF